MQVQRVRSHLAKHGLGERVIVLSDDTSTSPKAAEALGVSVGEIAKTICFIGSDGSFAIVVAAGDAKVSQGKLKSALGWTGKVKMASPSETMRRTGFPIGGVCPFALPEGMPILLDRSLEKYVTVYPAAGSPSSAVRLTPEELQRTTGGTWCSVTSDGETPP